MRYLVTGGAGFIGSHLVLALLEQGVDVRVLDNFSTGRRENLAAIRGQIDILEMDTRTYWVQEAVRCDIIFHEAVVSSPSPPGAAVFFDVNVTELWPCSAAGLALRGGIRNQRTVYKFTAMPLTEKHRPAALALRRIKRS
jgi:NAD(P)-dependent dehydrogenase (short-subunit alcohol dehydrogenase family)